MPNPSKLLVSLSAADFSVAGLVDNLLASCAQSLFAWRTLQHHGLQANALQAIFQATVVAKLSYASPSWWRYTNEEDKARLEAFLRRSAKLEYRVVSAPTLVNICTEAEHKLFWKVTSNEPHLLHPLLPPPRDEHHSLRN